MHSNAQTYRFALIITLACSLLLAAAATLLKPRQVENEKLDMKINILKSAEITQTDKDYSRAQIQTLYSANIAGCVIDKSGQLLSGKTPENLDPKKDTALLPVFEYKVGEEVKAYIIPISGHGLWSTIYGYLAIEPDGNTIKGITFYKNGETPGLGGEIAKKWYTDNYKGKKIFDPQGNLVSITVVKGKIADRGIPANEQYHYVDGISGASLTGRGVTHFLKDNLKEYEPFFKKLSNSKEIKNNG